MEIKKFSVEEYHRGEWQPLMVGEKGSKVQKVIQTYQHYVDTLNLDADAQLKESSKTKLFRYVEVKVGKKAKKEKVDVKDKSELEALRAEYKEVIGKKAYAGWDIETLKDKIEKK